MLEASRPFKCANMDACNRHLRERFLVFQKPGCKISAWDIAEPCAYFRRTSEQKEEVPQHNADDLHARLQKVSAALRDAAKELPYDQQMKHKSSLNELDSHLTSLKATLQAKIGGAPFLGASPARPTNEVILGHLDNVETTLDRILQSLPKHALLKKEQ